MTARIGRSGSAELFRGLLAGPSGFTRPVLVKRLRSEVVRDPRQVERLRTEALLTARVPHPNVLSVIDTVLIDGELVVAHEDAKITDLLRLLEICATQRRRLPPRVVLGIGWQIADALAVAHHRADAALGLAGIAHGDLSPSNVLIESSGRILLVDFGIGLHAQPSGPPLNKLGRLHGKPGYMSPELVVRGVIGPRSDFFALGTLLWEMLTLRRLFSGKDAPETLRNVALAQIDERFARHPEVPPFVQDVLRKALRRQPDERYADAREFQEALIQCHPQGFFGIEVELARLVEEIAPIPPDAPIELDVAGISRPRAKSRVASRMILPTTPGSVLAEPLSEDPGEQWSEAEAPEIVDVLDGLNALPPLQLDALPPPLPPEPPPLGPPPLPKP
ncbi:MAG: serine/threonine-protein kinase [Myxococcota bacterium]